MRKATILAFAAAAAIGAAGSASAGVLYSTTGSVYSQDFDTSLPTGTNPNNSIAIQYNGSAHIQNGNAPWPGGWKDDSPTDATNLGIPGWYLWSDVTTLTTATGGVNAHAQFRYGSGNATTGTGFFAFSSTITAPGTTDKALGIHSAAPFTDSASGRRSYIGLQFINNTGETLHSFNITYDGEQYREGTAANQDGFDLQWSRSTDAVGWHSNVVGTGFYSGTNGVDYGGFTSFLSPINNNPGALAAVDGNLPANRVAGISHTVGGIDWAPGAELWIRWRDGFAHDGIAIDNVRFSASTDIPEPSAFLLLASALLGCVCRRPTRCN